MSDLATNAGGITTTLDEFVERIGEVSSIPDVVVRVLEIVRDPDSSAVDLKSAVESDPALTTKILRHVNSAFYGLKSEIGTVHQSIAYLGFAEIRNLAVAASVADVFKNDGEMGCYSRRGLWRHMVSVGVAGRLIASRFRIPNFEDGFLGGILHDLGVILIDQYRHQDFETIMKRVGEDSLLAPIEQAVLGFDHTQVGSRTAAIWGFPENIVSVIRFHHDADGCPEDHRPMVRAIEVANYMCWAKGIGALGCGRVGDPSRETLDGLGMDRDDFRVLWEDLDQELQNARGLITT